MFDRYASLGRDCEVGFQLKRVRGAQETGFFNWNITDPKALLSLLSSNFAGILQSENLTLHGDSGLVRDASHDYMVHHEFNISLFRDAPDYSEKLLKLQEKFIYFADLFRQAAASPGRTAYFYKCAEPGARELCLTLQPLLARYHGENPFDIIVLQTQDKREPDWALPGIHNRYLKRFAPFNDTPDAHIISWDAVFREFPHKEPMRLVNY
jgi:hypothetical protein